MSREPFTLSGQMGGQDVDDVLAPHFQTIKRHLARLNSGGFGTGLREIAYIMRGDGAVRSFDLEGYGYFVVDKRDGSISIDIGVPARRWKGKSQQDIAHFLATSMSNAIPDANRELKRKGLSLDVEVVSRTLREALADYEAEFVGR